MRAKSNGAVSGSHLPAQPNQSLIGGMACLEMLVALHRPVGCREMARMLKMETTRVNRLLKTLTALGMAERTASRQYQPGPGIHVLASMSLHASRLLKVALEHIPQLQERFPDLFIALGVLWRSQVCYLFHGRHGQRIDKTLGHAELFPAEKSSIGRVLLAALPEAEAIQSLRNRTFDPFPREQEQELLKSFRNIRRQGYVLINDKSLGVPVGSPPVGGLAAAGALSPAIVPAVLQALKETSGKIAAQL